ncbi:TIR domain-containing protein [Lentzea sp. NEAU-D13]|uniref:TIR domain-containing protein n=1 Tax=Lentzea alba TaxID=2714351 RepID=A0A7C9W9Q2_9PSEU|nr:FxSxx-COOH system tetratricopeptide repeat protein [Lentzea alba]NGY65940.1 TIR domain-containing protein [Lentzea alba]
MQLIDELDKGDADLPNDLLNMFYERDYDAARSDRRCYLAQARSHPLASVPRVDSRTLHGLRSDKTERFVTSSLTEVHHSGSIQSAEQEDFSVQEHPNVFVPSGRTFSDDGEPVSTPEAPRTAELRRDGVSNPQVWGAVPLRNPDFVGRKQLLDQLRQRLLEPGATATLPEALHGMGGVGKTQMVVEYIYQHASEYDVVWWISAEQPAQITSSLVELAKRLGVPESTSADTAIPAVLEALRRGEPPHSRWILVFDNADRTETVRPFIPAGNGHVVITSRDSTWAGVARAVEVDLFSRAESKQLLSRRSGALTDADADRLAEALGDLPLAIEQAAAWRDQTGMQAEEYLTLLDQNRTELLETGTSSNDQLPVAAAWNVPLNRLKREHRAALQLLQVCAFFGPEPISRNLFSGVCGAPVPEALAEALSDPIKLHRAVKEISRYSLAKIDHRNNTLQLHRLVQTVLKNRLDTGEQEKMRHAVHVLLSHGDPGDPELRDNWPRYAELLPHATMSRAADGLEEPVRLLMLNLVRYLHASGDYGGARDLSHQCVEAWRAHRDETDLYMRVMARSHAAAQNRIGQSAANPVVFMSHSNADQDRFVVPITKSLERRGVRIWLDRYDMLPGHHIAGEVFEQIDNADAFIVVVSRHTPESAWVPREVDHAVKRADRDKDFRLICIRLDGVEAPAVLGNIASVKIDASLDYGDHLEKILRVIYRKPDERDLGPVPEWANT